MADETRPLFPYGETELRYLAAKDKRLGAAMERIGYLPRPCQPDLFEALVQQILGQQISSKAYEKICARLHQDLGTLTAEKLLALGRERLQAYGTSWRKVGYILDLAQKVEEGSLDLEALRERSDQEVKEILCGLKGIGPWTAEMLLLFSLQRKDVFSAGDLGIQRGLRMLYRHKELPPQRLERYRRRFSPYGSVACFYLWAISAGALPELTDPAPPKKPKTSRKKGA